MDPAVKEALTSNSAIFQNPEFDELKEYYTQGNINQDIQNVSNTLETDFQNVQDTIDDILAEQDIEHTHESLFRINN